MCSGHLMGFLVWIPKNYTEICYKFPVLRNAGNGVGMAGPGNSFGGAFLCPSYFYTLRGHGNWGTNWTGPWRPQQLPVALYQHRDASWLLSLICTMWHYSCLHWGPCSPFLHILSVRFLQLVSPSSPVLLPCAPLHPQLAAPYKGTNLLIRW